MSSLCKSPPPVQSKRWNCLKRISNKSLVEFQAFFDRVSAIRPGEFAETLSFLMFPFPYEWFHQICFQLWIELHDIAIFIYPLLFFWTYLFCFLQWFLLDLPKQSFLPWVFEFFRLVLSFPSLSYLAKSKKGTWFRPTAQTCTVCKSILYPKLRVYSTLEK